MSQMAKIVLILLVVYFLVIKFWNFSPTKIHMNTLTYFIKYINNRAYLYILLFMSGKYVITMVSFIHAKNKL